MRVSASFPVKEEPRYWVDANRVGKNNNAIPAKIHRGPKRERAAEQAQTIKSTSETGTHSPERVEYASKAFFLAGLAIAFIEGREVAGSYGDRTFVERIDIARLELVD